MSAAGVSAFGPDPAVVARAQAGCPDAFERIFAAYRTAIFNYLYSQCKDATDAEDFTQDVFVKAWRKIGDTAPELRVGPWLYRIALNVLRDEYRHRKVVQFLPLGQPDQHNTPGEERVNALALDAILKATTTEPAHEPEGLAVEGELRDEVRAIVAGLPPQCRAALTLRDLHGFSCGEVAARLGMTYAAAKSLLYRARMAFRDAYRVAHPEAVRVPDPRRSPAYGSGVAFRRDKASNQWAAAPYDPRTGRSPHLGYYPTIEAAQAAVAIWRAQQRAA